MFLQNQSRTQYSWPSDQQGLSLINGTGARGRGVTRTMGTVCFWNDGGFPFLTGQVGRKCLGIPGLPSDREGRPLWQGTREEGRVPEPGEIKAPAGGNSPWKRHGVRMRLEKTWWKEAQ